MIFHNDTNQVSRSLIRQELSNQFIITQNNLTGVIRKPCQSISKFQFIHRKFQDTRQLTTRRTNCLQTLTLMVIANLFSFISVTCRSGELSGEGMAAAASRSSNSERRVLSVTKYFSCNRKQVNPLFLENTFMSQPLMKRFLHMRTR